MNKKNLRGACGALLCAALLVLLCLSGVLDKQKIWANVPVEYAQGKQAFSLAEGDAYGPVTSGPYMELPAGTYRIKWQIEGDGVNAVQLSDSNDVPIVPARFETVPGAFEGEAYFELKDTVHNLNISVEFCGGTWMSVHNIRLYSPVYTDHYFTLFALLLLALIAAWMYKSGRLPQSRREILVPLVIAVIFASIPALREDTVFRHDVVFHANRLSNLADSLVSGQFPARVGGHTYNGYGAVTSVYYPDLLLYPQAMMLMLGASMTYVLNTLILEINALTAWCMYAAAKRIFSDRRAGAFAAILYVCCGFRLDRLYGSFMIGQILAMAFVPVFLWGLWEILFGNKERWPVLVVGATLIFQSHMLTTLLCAGVFALALVCCGARLGRERRFAALALAALTTVALNLTTLVPIVTTYLSGVTTSVGTYGFVELTHEAVRLLGTDKELGLAMILGVAALLCCGEGAAERAQRGDIVRLLLLGGVCAWMSTDMFPWSYVFALTGGALEILQFSWRFLAIGTACLALCGGLGYARLLRGTHARGLLAALAVAILCAAPVIEQALEYDVMEFGQDASPYVLTPEYQFEGTDLVATRSREARAKGDVRLEQYGKDGTRISAQVDARGDAELTFPLFAFDGYAAQLNGERIPWTRGENNCLTVSLPAGTQGELLIWFEEKAIWRAADAASLAGLLAFLAYCWKRRGALKMDGGECL